MQSIKPAFRVLLFFCAVSIVAALKFPLWKIILEAPQYPEGLKMEIWAHTIAGDVNKINGLNHYIGMALIKDENFPELKVMPYIIMTMALLGLVSALTGKRWMLWIFTVFVVVCGIYGMYDFWQWEYQYGHNLDPHAAIKIPGMSYQPPLIGWKQLLNFLAGSFPDTGGYLIIIPSFAAIGVLVYEQWGRARTTSVKH